MNIDANTVSIGRVPVHRTIFHDFGSAFIYADNADPDSDPALFLIADPDPEF
jgi:hypothetical protein